MEFNDYQITVTKEMQEQYQKDRRVLKQNILLAGVCSGIMMVTFLLIFKYTDWVIATLLLTIIFLGIFSTGAYFGKSEEWDRLNNRQSITRQKFLGKPKPE